MSNKNDRLYVVVHPFSTGSKYKGSEQYLKIITNFLEEVNCSTIVTQPEWALKYLKEKLSPLSLMGKQIVTTCGDPFDGDSPIPKIEWEKFKELINKFGSKEIIVCGAQLGIEKKLFGERYYRCVGTTYNFLKENMKNKVTLEKELCFVYDN